MGMNVGWAAVGLVLALCGLLRSPRGLPGSDLISAETNIAGSGGVTTLLLPSVGPSGEPPSGGLRESAASVVGRSPAAGSVAAAAAVVAPGSAGGVGEVSRSVDAASSASRSRSGEVLRSVRSDMDNAGSDFMSVTV